MTATGEEVTQFPGMTLDLYYGSDLIGTGLVGGYKPPPGTSLVGNLTDASMTA